MTKQNDNIVDISVLPKQFVISQKPLLEYGLWVHDQYMGCYIYRAPNLPLISILSHDNVQQAICLGWVVYRGELHNSDDSITLCEAESISDFLYMSSGRYACLYKGEDETIRIKLDAAGLLSAVYSIENQTIASTPALIAKIFGQKLDKELISVVKIPQKYGWYPFGLTPYTSIRRLLPNHLLDLSNWKIQRYKRKIIDAKGPTEDIISAICQATQTNVGAIVTKNKGIAHLTAGYDSRMVLAACRKYIENCQFETIINNDEGTKLDCHVASQLSNKHNLSYSVIPYEQPAQFEIDEWLSRVDNCLFDAVTYLVTTVKKNDHHYHVLTGSCGEVGRAYYWQQQDLNKTGLEAVSLISRLGMPQCDIFISEAEKWLSSIPFTKTTEILDYAYIEQRLGCWGGPSVYGHEIDYPTLSPFNSHEIFDLMLSLPENYRWKEYFAQDYSKYLWPELLNEPFNKASGLNRIKFLKTEIKKFLPNTFKTWIKSLRF